MELEVNLAGIGDNTVDIYIDQNIGFPGGNCVNFAVFTRRLGANSSYIGVIGNDEKGDMLYNALKDEGVNIEKIRRSDSPNSYGLVNHKDGDRFFVSSDTLTSKSLTLTEEDFKHARKHDHVHTSIFSRQDHELSKLKSLDLSVSYDFSDKFNDTVIQTVLPNIDYGFFSFSGKDKGDIVPFLKTLVNEYQKEIIVTAGALGSFSLSAGEVLHVPSIKVEPVDTIGAGDAFIAKFILSRLTGKKVFDSMIAGNQFAAENCLTKGSFGYGKAIGET
jgi:fructoselysine 6-kinase